MCISEAFAGEEPTSTPTDRPEGVLPTHPDERVQRVIEAETDSDAIDVAIDLLFDAALAPDATSEAVEDTAAAVTYGFTVRHGRVEETLTRAAKGLAEASGIELPEELVEQIGVSGRLVDEAPRG